MFMWFGFCEDDLKKYIFTPDDFLEYHKMTDSPVVYVLNTMDFEFVKIGYTKNLKQRMSNIQNGCSYDLNIFTCSHAPNFKEIEKYLHKYYSKFNVRGEWFSFGVNELNEIQDFFTDLNSSIRQTIRGI